MTATIYQQLKKQNGEAFAQAVRNHHNGILEIDGLLDIVRHAGRDAEPLLPYLLALISQQPPTPVTTPENPFTLLDQAGYVAFHADTLEKQNSIRSYFAHGEMLCTFNDSARHKDYHIVHAVRNDADNLDRADFNGREERQDAYGTSVISIQMLKTGGFISIKNRYNHAVEGCDHTFGSNPDNIIDGLSAALRAHFNVAFETSEIDLPEDYVLIGHQIFKYHFERDNIYYGDGAWAEDGVLHTVDKNAGNAMYDGFFFDNKTKTLSQIDSRLTDSFPHDFNRIYGGNRSLYVDKHGHLTLDGIVLIGAEESRMTSIYLPALTKTSYACLRDTPYLRSFSAPSLVTMGVGTLHTAKDLISLHAPLLSHAESGCLEYARSLQSLELPALQSMDMCCFEEMDALKIVKLPSLKTMGDKCFYKVPLLRLFDAEKLTETGIECVYQAPDLKLNAPQLTKAGPNSFYFTPDRRPAPA